MTNILAEKVSQAIEILREQQIDAWLTFVRETTEAGDTVLPLILGQNLTWQSALLITGTGERIAIIGNYDSDAVKSTGVWTTIVPYVQGIRAPLVEALKRIDPKKLSINFSPDDVKADGLSHGMYMLLLDYLADTPYRERLVTAEQVISALRGRKTPGEVERMRGAIATSDEIFAAVGNFARVGASEADVSRFMKQEATKRGVGLAWDAAQCPIVNSGPSSMVGHGIPSEQIRIEPGHIFHIDFGVVRDSYCSDIQRCWYVPKAGETGPPEAVQRAFDTIVRAIEAAARVLRPGVACWEVDAAARKVVIEAGYPEYMHATGHHVGRSAHDGGGVLGPRWERYGQTPFRRVEAGNVFTLELGIENVDGRGYLGLEEMVVVREGECAFLTNRQREFWILGRID